MGHTIADTGIGDGLYRYPGVPRPAVADRPCESIGRFGKLRRTGGYRYCTGGRNRCPTAPEGHRGDSGESEPRTGATNHGRSTARCPGSHSRTGRPTGRTGPTGPTGPTGHSGATGAVTTGESGTRCHRRVTPEYPDSARPSRAHRPPRPRRPARPCRYRSLSGRHTERCGRGIRPGTTSHLRTGKLHLGCDPQGHT